MNRFVYLDNNATTKVSEQVRDAVQEYLDLQFGNPSSLYQHGAKVKTAINEARENCVKLVNCASENLIFTSGGSEGNCTAFNSAIHQFQTRKRIVTTKVEHSSILEYCKLLENRGYEVVYLDVDSDCHISATQLEKAVNNNTCLVAIQYANNEVGTIILTDEILRKVKELKQKYGFMFHIDAVQVLGKLNIDIAKCGADFVSFSGHKVHCPKGIGMLYVADKQNFVPLITGHQEFGLRGGTENVLGIVAMGESCKNIFKNLNDNNSKILEVHNYLEECLNKIGGLNINCEKAERILNTTSVTFDWCDGNNMMFALEKYGICVSTGSACNSESSEPSYVLTSMGVKNPQNTIRISIDETTTMSQVDYFINHLKEYREEKMRTNKNMIGGGYLLEDDKILTNEQVEILKKIDVCMLATASAKGVPHCTMVEPSRFERGRIILPVIQMVVSKQNVAENPNVFLHFYEVNPSDPLNSTQYKISATATLETKGELFEEIKHFEETERLPEGLKVSGIIVAKLLKMEKCVG